MLKNDLTSPETLLAAVDLGSNSFRLEIGRYENGRIQRVDYLKETVRQGGSSGDDCRQWEVNFFFFFLGVLNGVVSASLLLTLLF